MKKRNLVTTIVWSGFLLTVVGELSLTRRVRLHARIAEMLEELYGPEADAHAAELAYHFVQAEAVLASDRLVMMQPAAMDRQYQSLTSTIWPAGSIRMVPARHLAAPMVSRLIIPSLPVV